jgi:uncharacterized Tic20 family protein
MTEPSLSPSAINPAASSLTITSEERTWAMLAHLSMVVNLITGMVGPIIALVIYLTYKNRSRYVAYQALQSLIIQIIGWVGGGALIAAAWAITGVLSLLIVGLCLIPFAVIFSFLPIATVVYSIMGAIQCNQGEDFRYWLVGDWVRGTYLG